MKSTLEPPYRGDITGALSAAIITLPMAIGYGVLAFAPLGAGFVPQAVLAGIFSAVFAGFFATLVGGSPIQITGPSAPLTLIYATLVSSLVTMQITGPGNTPAPALIIMAASVCLLIAGISQILLGALGVGALIKYVPQPVVAGFMNGIAFLLMTKQMHIILGIPAGETIFTLWRQPGLINPLSTVVGLVTIVMVFLSNRYIKRIPSSLLAILGGTTLYYVITAATHNSIAGDLIGKIQIHKLDPFVLGNVLLEFERIEYAAVLPKIVMTGLLLGLFASMESLLSSVVGDSLTGVRHDSKKELVGQGIGNMVSAIMGAIPASGSISRSVANYKAGGRSHLSGMLCAAIIFFSVLVLGDIIGKVPLSVIGGIIFVVGWSLIDTGTVNILKQIAFSKKYNRELLTDIGITLSVAVITVSVDLVAAVAIGIFIASGFFVVSMARSIVTRKYFANHIHSRKRRTNDNLQWLEEMGSDIGILELQGPLFFGSAENLAKEVEALFKKSTYCILDFKHVRKIDSTAARILIQLKKRARSKGKYLLFSQVLKNDNVLNFIEVMGMTGQFVDRYTFMDMDMALEWAEDHLLDQNGRRKQDAIVALNKMELFGSFTKGEIGYIREKMIELSFHEDEIVFNEGDRSRDLFLLTSGAMSVMIYLPEQDAHKRLFTYAPGIAFGEISFLDGDPRSASVMAIRNSKTLCLPFKQFERIFGERPEIATKILNNLALEISQRLRRTSNQLRILEDT